MNADVLQGKWHELKGTLKTQWAKLTDDDLTAIDGHAERLRGLLQQRYGYARDRAQAEIDQFLEDLEEPVSRDVR